MDLLLADGGRLSYETIGQGPPILLLRPLGGSLVSWDRFGALLAEHFHVVMFDPRGLGRSTSPPRRFSTRDMASDAVALLDALAIERCHVYGISMGGMVASWLAIDFPARVDRLVLASTLPSGLEVRASALRRAASLAQCLLRRGTDFDACLATRVLPHAFRDAHRAEVERIQSLARERPMTRTNLGALLIAASMHDVRNDLHRIVAPTLVLLGGRDWLPTLGSQAELLRRIPSVELQVLDDAGHDLSAEAPEFVALKVNAFLGAGAGSEGG